MRWTIRNQIMVPLVIVAIASLTTVGMIDAVLSERRTSGHVEQQLRNVIGVLTTSNFPLTGAVLRQMRDLSSAEFVLHDSSGQSVASTLADVGTLPETSPVDRIEDVTLGPSASVAGRSFFHTVVKFPVDGRGGRSGVLHVLFPRDEYRRAWRQAFIPSFVVGAATVAIVAAVAGALANRMGRAIARLREEVLRIARGDFREAPLPAVDDEIRDLSVAVNRTAEMLTDYEQQVRRSEQMRTLTMLGASIAHQIRNAATGCRMALDLHAADCAASDHGESLDVAKRQLQLMESQIQRFLRIGKQPAKLVTCDVELGDLVEDLLPLVRPAAEHAGVHFDCRLSAKPIVVSADKEALGQVVTNLLLNAIQAAQEHGLERGSPRRVCVEVATATDNAAEIVFSDSGRGPADTVAKSLFEPFVSDKAEGAGLGLAVAKEVVTAHGGTIEWKRENGMTQFRVELPLAKTGCVSVANSHC
jgi:signal transduction histidine kinase